VNQALVDQVVNAVLYEGYILYPYRPSVKNRQRWTFGGLYPEVYCRCANDASTMQTECLIAGNTQTSVSITVRFLHVVARQVAVLEKALQTWPVTELPPHHFVEALQVDERVIASWQEATERQVVVGEVPLDELVGGQRSFVFKYPGGRDLEPLRQKDGQIVAVIVRESQTLAGSVESSALPLDDGLFRLGVRVSNRTAWDMGPRPQRDDAILRALASTHTILGVRDGAFVSLLDPPEQWRVHANACQNLGTYPVLVGEEGATDTMLSSPIILYDYPQVAPESPGDLFDATEIDEILSLRILTLTEEEKRQVAAVDPRARALLERTESLGQEQWLNLHGTIRGMRSLAVEDDHA